MESNSQSDTEEFKKCLEWQLKSIYPPPDAKTINSLSRKPTKPNPENAQKFTLHAQPVEGVNEAQVNAKDGRIKVDKTARWPHSVHGVVAFKFNGQKFWGTGIIIGPNVVLTAGHNLYRKKDKIYAENVQFLPGMDGCLLPFGLVEVEKYFVSPRYIEEDEEDYGIIFLKEPIGEQTGYFGLSCLNAEEIKKRKINVTGYPGDKVPSKPDNIYEMWGMEGEASCVSEDKGEIQYMIDTGTGQSGSGVWYQEGDNYYVCGVHAKGNHSVNIATLLTRAVYQQIHAWLQSQQVSFSELFLKLKDEKDHQSLFWFTNVDVESISLLRKYNLDGLTSLNLDSKEIGNKETKMLALNTSWTKLSEIHLSFNNLGSEGARVLALNTSWTNLSQLHLSYNNLGSEGAKALALNTSWTNLSVLDLSNNNLGSEGARALALNTSWTNLSQLYLSYNNLGSEGARVLALNTSWTNLSVLNLSYNNLGSEGARALALNISWTNLSVLDLSNNNISSEGARALALNTSWTKLSILYLSYNNLGSEGARALALNTSWTNLSVLDLSNNNLGSEGARALALNTSWTKLSILYLPYNNLGSEGARALALNTSWTNLSKLYLSNNNISSEEVKVLKQHMHWKNLYIFAI